MWGLDVKCGNKICAIDMCQLRLSLELSKGLNIFPFDLDLSKPDGPFVAYGDSLDAGGRFMRRTYAVPVLS